MVSGHLCMRTQKKMEAWSRRAGSAKVRVLGTSIRFVGESRGSQTQLAPIKILTKTAGKNAEGPYLLLTTSGSPQIVYCD